MLIGTPLLQGNELTVLCGGVGYAVAVNLHTLRTLSPNQKDVTLYVHTHVREDVLDLFGFLSSEEKRMFEMLLTVSGVGPKTALAVTDASPPAIRKAIEDGDVSFFSAFPRVGKKLAQKIIIELKPKIGSLHDLDLTTATGQTGEVRQALETLGYTDNDIRKALQSIEVETLPLQSAIKESIRFLSKS
ncbi:MAG: Holliday junction branch migration protein RuvA [Candidatus Pacebacteria bacterium]|nr:Holliday junction branch migration protein RuvA [Candidatus Paceibacterota bacterium]